MAVLTSTRVATPVPRRTTGALAFDVLLSASILGWGIRALMHSATAPGARLSLVVVGVLHGVVAWLVISRAAARREGGLGALVLAAPAIVVGAAALGLAPDIERWPPAAHGLFIAGGLVAAVSLWTLGRSFAVLPALRSVVDTGPYRWVRHPAYAGELLMLAACCVASKSWFGGAVMVLALGLVVVRILAEERLLSTDVRYRAYGKRVTYRLVYGLW